MRLRRVQTLRSIFAIPLLMSVATLLGLGLGLAGDDGWDIAAWFLLGLCPAVFIFAWLTRRARFQ